MFELSNVFTLNYSITDTVSHTLQTAVNAALKQTLFKCISGVSVNGWLKENENVWQFKHGIFAIFHVWTLFKSIVISVLEKWLYQNGS